MGVFYELKEIDEASSENTTSNLMRVNKEQAEASRIPRVEVYTPDEFDNVTFKESGITENVRDLMTSDVNFVDTFSDYIAGSFAVPDKTSLTNDPDMFAFYMDKMNLIFVDEGDTAEKILASIAESGIMRDASTAHCLYVFLRELLINDLVYLGALEDSMESFEENMLKKNNRINPDMIMQYRRKAMQLGLYYQQIATMASILEDDENEMMSVQESDAFAHIVTLTDRLAMRADTLKEYGVQLYELQQSKIGMEQNSIMQIFTIITVLFAPLTLVTGWFGMNLSVIPLLSFPYMWLCIIVGGIILTAILLLAFWKRRWL